MALQYSVALRNAKLDQMQTTIGASAVLKIFSGSQSADVAAADPTGLLCTITLPSAWMAAASGGSKSMLPPWTGNASDNGVAASWRIYDPAGVTCYMQGNLTTDMTIGNTNLANGQTVTVSTFTITSGNA